MEDATDQPISLLEDLDARQNDVLQKLDELNQRIEVTLKTWTSQRDAQDCDR